jgi:geranylgeranyl reductase family protein
MVSIIGAGPAGSYLASLLAKQGKEVALFEEHDKIGKPVHCTGIVTDEIRKIVKLREDVIINKISGARIYSSKNGFLEINFKNKDFVLDRAKFDKSLADFAVDNGAELNLNHRLIGIKRIESKKNKNINYTLKFKNKKQNNSVTKQDNIIVGADGANSTVAKISGLWQNRKFFVGVQARFKGKYDSDSVLFYPDIGDFSWVVPESDKIARIGLITRKNPYELFKSFAKGKGKLLEYQSGIVPIYNPNIKTVKDNIFLLGDAATHVKATTAGGIIQSLLGAKQLSESILKNKKYDWKRSIGKDLYVSLLMRKVMDRFSQQDYDELIHLCQNSSVKKVLATTSRDDALALAIKVLLSQPRLLKFAKKLL